MIAPSAFTPAESQFVGLTRVGGIGATAVRGDGQYLQLTAPGLTVPPAVGGTFAPLPALPEHGTADATNLLLTCRTVPPATNPTYTQHILIAPHDSSNEIVLSGDSGWVDFSIPMLSWSLDALHYGWVDWYVAWSGAFGNIAAGAQFLIDYIAYEVASYTEYDPAPKAVGGKPALRLRQGGAPAGLRARQDGAK